MTTTDIVHILNIVKYVFPCIKPTLSETIEKASSKLIDISIEVDESILRCISILPIFDFSCDEKDVFIRDVKKRPMYYERHVKYRMIELMMTKVYFNVTFYYNSKYDTKTIFIHFKVDSYITIFELMCNLYNHFKCKSNEYTFEYIDMKSIFIHIDKRD